MGSDETSGFIEHYADIVRFYRKNPVLAARDILEVELAVPQRRILDSMWFKNFVIVSAGRGTGKSFLDALVAVLWALLYPGQKVGLLAPSFRQVKTVFAEVEKIWSKAPLLQEATDRRPIRQSDRCVLVFRQSGNRPPSTIEGVPLGDGQKIRGARYHLILADEFAQIPESIFNSVIVPMGATSANPMENVKRVAFRKKLLERGLSVENETEGPTNKIIMTSSAFYQFNHMFNTLLKYEQRVAEGDDRYAVHRLSYRDMPEGFLDNDNLMNAKERLSRIEFLMEYEALWQADSSGVFKASLIERCKSNDFSVNLSGDPSKEYVLGIDPARTSDACALCMMELGTPSRVVGAWEYYRTDFPTMASNIMQLCSAFNVVFIHMDAAGGGTAIKDLLEEEGRWPSGQRILDMDDEKNVGLAGRHILRLANFSPRWISEAVYGTLNLLEKGGLVFPRRPRPEGIDEAAYKKLDVEEEVFETVERTISQLLMIEVSESRAGVPHFDVPSGGGHAAQKKDLYTAFILAGKQVYDLTISREEPEQLLQLGIIEQLPEIVPPSRRTGQGPDWVQKKPYNFGV